ncbi:MAG: amidohydrolase family protein [Planctomycetaceae bacterium]
MRPAEPSLNRRGFLATAASAGAVLATAASGMADDTQKPAAGAIDAHAHIWTSDLDRYPLAGDQTADDLKPRDFTDKQLIELGGQFGVDRFVLIQHGPYHGFDNSYITDAIAAHPGVFSAVAGIDDQRPDQRAEIERLAGLGVRGFRIRPVDGGGGRWIDSPAMRSFWDHATELRLAMCPLINPEHIPMVDEMAARTPETTVVVDHFARVGMDGEIRPADVDALCRLARHPNMHVKISAYYALGNKRPPYTDLIPMIRRLLESFGAERLMWASDSPYQLAPPNSYAASLALVREHLDFLTDAERDWLLRGTAERVFFTKDAERTAE